MKVSLPPPPPKKKNGDARQILKITTKEYHSKDMSLLYIQSEHTKSVNITFHVLWLATQAWDILWYPLVFKTQWTRVQLIIFVAEFWADKIHVVLSLAIHCEGDYSSQHPLCFTNQ